MRNPAATYNSILAAARAVMAEQGPDGLSVSAVARLAGVNRATAYQHFRSREDLATAALFQVSEETSRMLKAEMPINQRIDHMLEYFLNYPEIARLWMYQMLADLPLADRGGQDRYLRAMTAFARSPLAKEGIDPEMLGEILVASVLVWSLKVRSRSVRKADECAQTIRFARELKRLLLYGAVRAEKAPEVVKSIASGSRSRVGESHQTA